MNEERIPVALTEAEWVQIANIIQKEPLKDVFTIFMSIDNQIGQYKQQKEMQQMEMQRQMEKSSVEPPAEEGPEEK